MIFFIAIFTVLQLVMLGASTYPIKYRWDSAAYRSEEEVRCDTLHFSTCMAQQIVQYDSREKNLEKRWVWNLDLTGVANVERCGTAKWGVVFFLDT